MSRTIVFSLVLLLALLPAGLIEKTDASQSSPRAALATNCGPPGTFFELQWTGFTPNRTLTSHMREPDGTEFPIMQFNTDGQGNASAIVDSTNFTTGTYQHWAVDDATGSMSNVVSFDVGGSAPAITFGQNVVMFLSAGQTRNFTFCARMGDALSVRFVGTRYVALTLTDSTGAVLATNNSYPARIDVTLLRGGDFQIIARDNDCCSGDFGLNIQRVNNPGLATPLACGENSLVLLNAFERHTYTFNGNTGDRVTITMNRGTIGDIRPFLELYDPDGRPLAIQPASGSTATISGVTLRKTGKYTILASELDTHSGSYTISLQCQR